MAADVSEAPNAIEPRTPEERRGWTRYSCTLQGQCRPMTAMEAGNTWPVQTVDLSAGGVAVRICRRFEPGTLIALDISDTTEESMSMPLARVRYVVSVGSYWLLGCAWAEALEQDDMRALLGSPTAWQCLPVKVQEALAS